MGALDFLLNLAMEQSKQLNQVETIIAYRFSKPDKAYLKEALRTFKDDQSPVAGHRAKDGNRKLAIIGDAIMAVVVAEYWYSDKDSSIRDWAAMHHNRLSNHYLRSIVLRTGLDFCVKCHGHQPSKDKAGTLLEAVIGAVYLDSDCNLSAVRNAMVALGFAEVVVDKKTGIYGKTVSKPRKKKNKKKKKTATAEHA
ncbi:hypothetical protein D6D27_01789 [Aureobasidium pullulans]|nr:hypothetical protein D6D27_01789 [Aureobasidium pullulans]